MRKLWLYLVTLPVMGQQPLSLHDAVALALRENRAVVAAEAGVRAADERLNQAKSGMLPRVNISESAMRGNNPVYVFSSLLTQHQFGAGNFNLGPLNRPDALTNFQTQLTVDQPIYDARQTRNATSTAQLSGRMAAEDQRRTGMETIARVAQTYYGAMLAVENLKAAGQAVRSAEADLRRAEDVRAAGMSTDVDVLSIKVHLASVNEQRITRQAQLDVARAALNDAMGLPLEAEHVLAGILSPTGPAEMVLGSLEKEAAEGRAETRQSRLATSLAEVQNRAAHDSWLPQIGVRAAFETDAQRFVTRGGANWMAGVTVRWNVFNGFADRAKMAETSSLLEKARADEQRAGSAVKLQVRQAYAGLQAASQRIQVAATAVAAAEESLRITQNRYEAGLATVTDLLRTETALLDTKTRYLASLHDERLAATMVEFAAGRLTADSGVLNQ
ncbi:MAG: TolC family protein [Acidobacteriia bacterium]|nr:TolC family protein [Terriglobia bacterium]